MKTEKKNLRRISIVVTAQTKGNLERLAAVVRGMSSWKISGTVFLTASVPKKKIGTVWTWFLTTSRQSSLQTTP